MYGRLLLENLIESHPGIEEFSLERDLRGAVLHVRVVVKDDDSKARLHEMVARTIGRNFADERLAVFTSSTNGVDSGRVLLREVKTTLSNGEVRVEVALADMGADGERRSRASKSGRSKWGHPRAGLRLAAEATLGALSDLVNWNASVAIERADLIQLEEEPLVIVGLILQSSRATTKLYGVSRTGSGGEESAAARAVLSALNRLIQ